MTEWLGALAPAGHASFDELADRLRRLPRQWVTGPAALPAMAQSDLLVYVAHRILDDACLTAASRELYEQQWIIRQMADFLTNYVLDAAPVAVSL